jgi:hypothetical protein
MQLKLENIGITNFVVGELNTEGTELVFTAITQKTFRPASQEMVIETQFTKVPRSGKATLEVDLQWTEAEIKPGDNGLFEDTMEGLNLNALGEVLGGAKFGKIPAYLYISGLDDADAQMSISATTTASGVIIPPVLPQHDIASQVLPVLSDKYSASIEAADTSVGQFFLEQVFNAGGEVSISYKIQIKAIPVYPPDDNHPPEKIKADMVVVLPLRLTVDPTNDNTFTYDAKPYVELSLDALSGLTGDGDLLGRDSGDDSLFIDGLALDHADILIKNITNNVIEGLYLAILKDPDDHPEEAQVISLDDGQDGSISFTGSELGSPFSPGFKLLLEKNKPIAVKTFDDKNPAKLDLNLALSAKTDLNISQKF